MFIFIDELLSVFLTITKSFTKLGSLFFRLLNIVEEFMSSENGKTEINSPSKLIFIVLDF